MSDIDFVIIWVDGSDESWKKEKAKYDPGASSSIDAGDERYRDWDNLRYWFRGVEKYAPWVHRIHFVTCGHLPSWLNVDNEKINIVKHSDYMDSRYLPTFSSHPIELNLHRIKGLSDRFVYFNDDMFITDHVSEDMFFCGGVPVHPAQIHPVVPLPDANGEIMSHIYINMVSAINRHFDVKRSFKKDRQKWLSLSSHDPKTIFFNMVNSHFIVYVGFGNEHLPVPILKSTMEDVWDKEYDLLDATSMRKFRSSSDVSQYLFRYWDLASGNFVPIKAATLGKRYTMRLDCKSICDAIRTQKHKLVCLNDISEKVTFEQFEGMKNSVIEAFEAILPDKSSFEI